MAIVVGLSVYVYKNQQLSKVVELPELWREYPVEKGDILSYFDGSGKVNFDEVTYTRPYWMMVEDIYVKEGEVVKKGQPLLLDGAGNTLVAEENGVVTKLFAEKKKEVQYKKPIVTIANSDSKYIKVNVKQDNINDVAVDQKVRVNFIGDTSHEISTQVTEINGTPKDGQEGPEYEVTLRFNDDEISLLPGMTCSAKFVEKELKDVLTVSNKGIQTKDGQQFVMIQGKDGKKQKRQITTGFSDGRVSEITGGLKEGDIALVKG